MGETLEEAVVHVDNEVFSEAETIEKENLIRKLRKLSQPIIVSNNSSVAKTEEINEKINEYIVRGKDGNYSCGYCGKIGDKKNYNIKSHIETHMEGLSYPC